MTAFLIVLLFSLGVLAILLEVTLPYGIAATLGGILILFSGYLAIVQYGAVIGSFYCVVAATVAFFVARLTIKSGLKRLTLRPTVGRRTDPSQTSVASVNPPMDAAAEVVQPLRPTGTIEWSDHRLPARSLHPEKEIPIGAEVRIKGKDSIYWLVEEPEAGAAGTDSTPGE